MTHGGSYKPRKLITLKCSMCPNTFEATRPDALYCGENCRKQGSRLKRRPDLKPFPCGSKVGRKK